MIIEEEQEKIEERLQHRIDYHKRQEQKVEKWKRKQRDLGKVNCKNRLILALTTKFFSFFGNFCIEPTSKSTRHEV